MVKKLALKKWEWGPRVNDFQCLIKIKLKIKTKIIYVIVKQNKNNIFNKINFLL